MLAGSVVRARIDAPVNKGAALPSDPSTPNARTVEAMKAARLGNLVNVGSVENLLADLRSDD
jgi:antitoxin component of RelBE/YafQ-DinJ toxin-antitoxin module